MSKVLRQLRLRWEDFGLSPQRFSTVAFPDCTLRFTNCIDDLMQQIRERFPSEVDGFTKLVEHVANFEVASFEKCKLSARAVVGDFLSDALLIEMLMCPLLFYGSATPNDMDFTQFAIMFRSIFLEGFAPAVRGRAANSQGACPQIQGARWRAASAERRPRDREPSRPGDFACARRRPNASKRPM